MSGPARKKTSLLSIGMDNMVNDFLAWLTSRDSVPLDSLLIAYISIAQGGLGLMHAHTRAVSDFVLTMSQAKLLATLCGLFYTHQNDTSDFHRTFYRLLM